MGVCVGWWCGSRVVLPQVHRLVKQYEIAYCMYVNAQTVVTSQEQWTVFVT